MTTTVLHTTQPGETSTSTALVDAMTGVMNTAARAAGVPPMCAWRVSPLPASDVHAVHSGPDAFNVVTAYATAFGGTVTTRTITVTGGRGFTSWVTTVTIGGVKASIDGYLLHGGRQ